MDVQTATNLTPEVVVEGGDLESKIAAGTILGPKIIWESPVYTIEATKITGGTFPVVAAPPISNEFVAEGCEQFSVETIAANAAPTTPRLCGSVSPNGILVCELEAHGAEVAHQFSFRNIHTGPQVTYWF